MNQDSFREIDQPDEEQIGRAVEALLFAADGPLSVDQIRDALEEAVELRMIRTACQALRLEYDKLERAFELVEVANGFQFRTRPEFGPLVARLKRTSPLKMSKAALEALSIVAYKQPVLRAEVERIRGVDSGGVLKALLERGLVRIVGRENLPGRPLTYGTTKRFLEVFELKSLEALPRLEELALEQLIDRDPGPDQEELFPLDEETGEEPDWEEEEGGEPDPHGPDPEEEPEEETGEEGPPPEPEDPDSFDPLSEDPDPEEPEPLD